jgi:hypothetical protein
MALLINNFLFKLMIPASRTVDDVVARKQVKLVKIGARSFVGYKRWAPFRWQTSPSHYSCSQASGA